MNIDTDYIPKPILEDATNVTCLRCGEPCNPKIPTWAWFYPYWSHYHNDQGWVVADDDSEI